MSVFIPSVTTMQQADSMDLTSLLALRRDLERFRLLVENSQDLMAEVTQDGVVVYVSPNVRTLLGFGPREVVQQSVFDYVHPDDLPGVRAQFARPEGLATCRFQHKNGSWRWLEISCSEFFTPEGEKHGVLIARDVTARKEAEEAQRSELGLEEQLRQT